MILPELMKMCSALPLHFFQNIIPTSYNHTEKNILSICCLGTRDLMISFTNNQKLRLFPDCLIKMQVAHQMKIKILRFFKII